MSFELRHEPGFTVAGLSARVSNAEPERIGELWGRFHAMGGAQAIAARLNDTVYSIYCEYAGDHTQPYTVVLGCAVPENHEAAAPSRRITVQPGRFAVLQVTGPLPQGVMDAWGEVWTSPLDRRYNTDYDRYGADGLVTIHVGVR